MGVRFVWGVQIENHGTAIVTWSVFESNCVNLWLYLQCTKRHRAHILTGRADVSFTNVLQHKDRSCISAMLMADCIHCNSWLWEIEMIYLHFSYIWDTIKHWCWYPCGNVDWITFLPTVYLPAASSVGSMHQNLAWHDATFHLQALESHRCRLCPLPLSVCIHPLSPSPKHIICHLEKLFPISLAITVEHFVISRIKGFSIKRLHIIHWPWLHAARLLMSP